MCGDKAFGDLPEVLGELKEFLASAKVDARAHAEEAVATWRNALKGAQERLKKLAGNTRERLRAFLLELALHTHEHTPRSL